MKALKNKLSASKIGVWLGVTTFECFLVFSFVLMFLGFVTAYVVFTAIDAVFKPRMRKCNRPRSDGHSYEQWRN